MESRSAAVARCAGGDEAVISAQQEINPQPATQTWCLRLVDGNMAWSNWPLSETPLVIGRGLGCRMRIEDNRVSRIQCEVRLVGGVPRLRNRSESSATHVNGTVCDETELRLGDLIEFTNVRLIVDFLPMQPEPVNHAPTTRAFVDTPYNLDLADASVTSSHPNFTSDLLSLFHFSRKLSQADSLDAVVHEIRTHLAQRLHPDARWLAWRVRTDGDITLYPAATPDETAAAPLDALRQACIEQRGVIGTNAQGTFAAAPLVHGGEVFGALCVERHSPRDLSDKHLQYLLAVAECAAPHIRAAERQEQFHRDGAKQACSPDAQARMLGSSAAIHILRESIRQAARARVNVLLLGETGTGKELAARMIHDLSGRAAGPYVVVNCAAIPAELFESEMFGHERGSFTGALQRHKGLFEQAHGGTLFLDEVADLSLPNQARVLRAVDSGAIRRVGAEQDLSVDVRVVAATNKSLPDVTSAYFRMDLFHRLAGMVLNLPALRERKADIPELAQHFLALCSPHTPARPVALAPVAIEQMLMYDWPGNIRELRNVVERAGYLATTRIVASVGTLSAGAQQAAIPLPDAFSLDEIERRHLEQVLEAHRGDVAAAAKSLGLAKSTLYYKLSKHDIARRGRKR